jgi:hypothetical protein
MRVLPHAVAATVALAATAGAVSAQSIDPSTYEATIGVGETITIEKTITLGAAGATTVDIFFLADNTGSMGSIIGQAQTGASAILGALPGTYRFGVGQYNSDPCEAVPGGCSFSSATTPFYGEDQALTFDKADVEDAIDTWAASGGGDGPEGNFFALKEVAETASWRPEAQRLVVWFGDASSHTATVTQAEAIDALVAADAKVIAFNSGSGGFGIDAFGQASSIVAGAGGTLVNRFRLLTGSAFVDAVTGEIEEATSTLDLFFASTYAGTGLDISFTCTDALGCDDVGAEETREFEVSITGLEPGTYDFEVFARGVDAVERDRITVVGDVVTTPEPGTMLLLGAGLLGLGVVGYRREDRPAA